MLSSAKPAKSVREWVGWQLQGNLATRRLNLPDFAVMVGEGRVSCVPPTPTAKIGIDDGSALLCQLACLTLVVKCKGSYIGQKLFVKTGRNSLEEHCKNLRVAMACSNGSCVARGGQREHVLKTNQDRRAIRLRRTMHTKDDQTLATGGRRWPSRLRAAAD